MAKQTKKMPVGTTISNCTFTGSPSVEVTAAALQLVKAAEANTLALQKIAEALKGDAAPLLQITGAA